MDLRDVKDPAKLRANARAYLYSFMLFPSSDLDRRRFRRRLIQFWAGSPLVLHIARDKDFRDEWIRRHLIAMQAGQVFLTILQAAENGAPHDLSRAIANQKAHIPPYPGHTPAGWSKEGHLGHLANKRDTILAAVKDFGPVIHLWAAEVQSEQYIRGTSADAPPVSRPDFDLPLLVARAEALWAKYANIEPPMRGKVPVIPMDGKATILLPADLIFQTQLFAFPLE